MERKDAKCEIQVKDEKRIDNIERKRSAIVMEIEFKLRKNKRERELCEQDIFRFYNSRIAR